MRLACWGLVHVSCSSKTTFPSIPSKAGHVAHLWIRSLENLDRDCPRHFAQNFPEGLGLAFPTLPRSTASRIRDYSQRGVYQGLGAGIVSRSCTPYRTKTIRPS